MCNFIVAIDDAVMRDVRRTRIARIDTNIIELFSLMMNFFA